MQSSKETLNLASVENPKISIHNDAVNLDFLGQRIYKSADKKTHLFSDRDPLKTSREVIRQYVVGGWLRWLSFVNSTYNMADQDKPAVIFRLISNDPEVSPITDYDNYGDRVAYLSAYPNSYNFCVHDVTLDIMNLCQNISFTGSRENEWHFVILMYNNHDKTFHAKAKINGVWQSSVVDNSQYGFDGYLGLYLGNDLFTEGRSGFNGELAGWNSIYGYDFLTEFINGDPENIISNSNFTMYMPVPYVDLGLPLTCSRYTSINSPDDSITFIYENTFLEAVDYGVSGWLKLNPSQGGYGVQEVLTLSFENDPSIDTPGLSIASLYIEENKVMAQVNYINETIGNKSSFQEIEGIVDDEWFFVQFHFSSSDQVIRLYVNDEEYLEWADAYKVWIPKNVIVAFGNDQINGYAGAEFEFRNAVLYAGDHLWYDQDQAPSMVQIKGTNFIPARISRSKRA